MQRIKLGEWVSIGTLVISLALTIVLYVWATPTQKAISGYGLTAWATLSGLLSCVCSTPPNSRTRWDDFLRATTTNCWLILIFCAEPWGAVLSKNTGMFTTMFPVTLPPAIRTIIGSRKTTTTFPGSYRYLSAAIFVVAAGNLVVFFPSTSAATHLFLAFFTLVSGLNAHRARQS